MDDRLKGQAARRGSDGTAKRNRAVLSELFERAISSEPLDGARDPLRKEEPPGDDVPVPGVDDGVNVLLEEVTLNDRDGHLSRVASDWRAGESGRPQDCYG